MAATSTVDGGSEDRLQLYIKALATENSGDVYTLSYVYVRTVLAVQGPQPNTTPDSLAAGGPDAMGAKINGIILQAIKKQQEAYEEFTKEIEALKGSEHREPEWRRRLEAKREEIGQKSAWLINESYSAAEEYITSLPLSQSMAATDHFNKRQDEVSQAGWFVVKTMKEVIGWLWEIFEVNWEKVRIADNAVHSYLSERVEKSFPMPIPSGPPSTNSGLYEGAIAWKQSISLADAAARLDVTCSHLSSVIERARGPRPVYTVFSKFVELSEGKCVANILFDVTKHAPQLGQYFKGLLENRGTDITTSWTTRGIQSIPLPSIETPSTNDIDCPYGLIWSNRDQSLTDSTIQSTLNTLQSGISAALNGKYIVQTTAFGRLRDVWMTDMICRKVDRSDAPWVSDTIRKVFTDELTRKPRLFISVKLWEVVREKIIVPSR